MQSLASRGLHRRSVVDQVLGAFQPEQLLVTQGGQPARGVAEQPGQGAFADAGAGGQVCQRQWLGESVVDEVLGAVDDVIRVRTVPPAAWWARRCSTSAGLSRGPPRSVGARQPGTTTWSWWHR
jgi:hypothetical protein